MNVFIVAVAACVVSALHVDSDIRLVLDPASDVLRVTETLTGLASLPVFELDHADHLQVSFCAQPVCRFEDQDFAAMPSGLLQLPRGTHTIVARYVIPRVLSAIATNAVTPLALQQLRASFPLHRHVQTALVTLTLPASVPGQTFAMCGNRAYALYSQSGHGVRPENCQISHNCKVNCAEPPVDFSASSATLRRNSSSAQQVLQLTFAWGTWRAAASPFSAQRTDTCRALLYASDVSFVAQLVGDVLFPLKVLFVLLPLSLLGLVALLKLVLWAPLLAAPVAIAAIAVDSLFMLATLVYPLCSVSVGLWGFGLVPALMLVAYYTGFMVAFWKLDAFFSTLVALPPAVQPFLVRRWLPHLMARFPVWLPLPIVLFFLASGFLLCWFTALASPSELCRVALLLLDINAVTLVCLDAAMSPNAQSPPNFRGVGRLVHYVVRSSRLGWWLCAASLLATGAFLFALDVSPVMTWAPGLVLTFIATRAAALVTPIDTAAHLHSHSHGPNGEPCHGHGHGPIPSSGTAAQRDFSARAAGNDGDLVARSSGDTAGADLVAPGLTTAQLLQLEIKTLRPKMRDCWSEHINMNVK